MHSPSDIVLRRVLVGHRAAVNVVDFDDRYIVSASGDRTIKVRITGDVIHSLYYYNRYGVPVIASLYVHYMDTDVV